jgi:formylmethanofuran dehydrogenase subunit E
MVMGYQLIPSENLFKTQPVLFTPSLAEIISKPGKKAQCQICNEEIINGREVMCDGSILCLSCADENYYEALKMPKPC